MVHLLIKAINHPYGELLKARSTFDENLVMDWRKDIRSGDFCEHNKQLRPHIVWFGEAVPMFQKAADHCAMADILIIVGTSMQVYPAAGLVDFIPKKCPVYFIDPKPNISETASLEIISKKAVEGIPKLVAQLLA